MTRDTFALGPESFLPIDLEEVDREVFVTPFLTPEAAQRVLAEADRRAADATPPRPGALHQPSSMHDHGVTLESLGMKDLVDHLIDGAPALRALLADRFRAFGGDALDGHYSYLVDYGRSGDEDLGFHVDDSEVTLNLCLGETFSGSELVMLGRRCDQHRQTPVQAGETVEILHEPGALVVHAGRHRHRVDPIRTGRRRNLIAWLRSSSYRAPSKSTPGALGEGEGGAQGCPSWCGWG